MSSRTRRTNMRSGWPPPAAAPDETQWRTPPDSSTPARPAARQSNCPSQPSAHSPETNPDDAPRPTITIHFRKYVAENISDREQQLRAASTERAKGANFLPHQIGDDQHDNEDAGEQIV